MLFLVSFFLKGYEFVLGEFFRESQGENVISTSPKYKERKNVASEIHNSAHCMSVVEL